MRGLERSFHGRLTLDHFLHALCVGFQTPLSSSLKHERASPLKKAQPPSPVRPSPRRSSSSSSSQHAPSPRRHNESLLSRKTHPVSESAPMDVDGEAEEIEEDDGNVKEEEEEDIEE